MFFRPLGRSAVAVLATGSFIACAIPFAVFAGDKIQFSAPDVSLKVPEVVADDSQQIESTFQAPTPVDNGIYPDQGEVAGYSEVYVVMPPKKDRDRRSDSLFSDRRDDRDNDLDDSGRSDDYGRSDGYFSDDRHSSRRNSTADKQKKLEQSLNMDGDGYHDGEGAYLDRRSREGERQDNLRARLDSMTTSERNDYERNDRFLGRTSDSGENSAWTARDIFHRNLMGTGHAAEGQLALSSGNSTYEGTTPLTQQFSQGYSPARTPDSIYNAQQNPALQPGLPDYADHRADRADNPQTPVAIPRRESKPASQPQWGEHPNLFGPEMPPASAPGNVQSQPAILPIPKKPGDVLY